MSSNHFHHLQDSWEIVEGLRGGLCNVLEPQKQDGYMLKRRKWPMKGWHKVKSISCQVLKRLHLPHSSLRMLDLIIDLMIDN